jgi:prevent-host-death family protein
MKPMSVGVRDAKVQLSRLLKLVQKGREVILTDRGRPVGKIIPVDTQTLPLAERLRRLEEEGVIEPRSHSGVRKIPSPIAIPEGVAQRFLREDRELA